MPQNPFGPVPTGAEFYEQAVSDYGAQKQASAQVAAIRPAASAPVPEAADLYAPYREKPGATFDIYDGDQVAARVDLDTLLREKDQDRGDGTKVGDLKLTVLDPNGERRGIAVRDLEPALAQGFKLSTSAEDAVARYLAKHEGDGAALVAAQAFSNQLFLGVPEAYDKATQSPEQLAKFEALKAEHEYVGAAAAAAGFAGSLLVGGPLFKGAAKAGLAAEGVVDAAANAMTGRLAQVGVEAGTKRVAKGIVQEALGQAAKMGVEAGIVAAPQAVTEAALGDPRDAAETILLNVGIGGLFGAGTGAGKAMVRRALEGIQGLRVTASKGASEAAVLAADGAQEVATNAADDVVEGGLASGAVDSLAEQYIGRQKVGEEVKDALRRGYADNATNSLKRSELRDAVGAEFKSSLDTTISSIEKARRVAFGEGKEKQIAQLIPDELGVSGYERALASRDALVAKVEELKSLRATGGEALPIRKMEQAVAQFDLELTAMQKMGIPEADMSRQAFSSLDKVKRAIGKQAAMGRSAGSRNELERFAYDTYHELLPVLQDEAAFGPAGLAQKEINASTTEMLARSEHFRSQFVANYESLAGNAITEAAPEKVLGYLKNAGSFASSATEDSLQAYLKGAEGHMAAIEKHYKLSGAEKAAFEEGKAAIAKLRTVSEKAKGDAKALSILEALQEDERGKAIGGIAGLAADFFTRPTTVIDRLASARKLAQRVEKLGVLTAEQSVKLSAERLDKVPALINAMAGSVGSVRVPEGVAARSVFSLAGAKGGDPAADYLAATEALSQAQGNLAAMAGKMNDMARVFSEYGAPEIGKEFVNAQANALKFLYEALPKDDSIHLPFEGKSTWKPTRAQMLSFHRKAEIVEDPFLVFEHLKAGTLMPEHVAALKAVYPGYYRKFVQRIAEHAGDPKAPVLPPKVRDRLAAFAGVPMPDRTASAKALQQNFLQEEPGKIKPRGARSSRLAEDTMTETQRISGK